MIRLLMAAVALSTLQLTARSEQPVGFCVISKIFVADQAKPAAEHLILFDSGVVYDLPQIEDRFVTVYDPAQGSVTLLDRLTQVQATLSTDDLTRISAQARAAAKNPQQQEKLGLLAAVEKDAATGLLKIQFGNFAYVTTTQTPTRPLVATHYGVFFDLAARLNIVRRLGPPPFARMSLNSHLTAAKKLPLDTKLTITRESKTETYRSTLQLIESLSSDHRARIQEVAGMLELYRDVSLKDFPVDR